MRQFVIADVLVRRPESLGVDAARLNQSGGNRRFCLDLGVGHKVLQSVMTIVQLQYGADGRGCIAAHSDLSACMGSTAAARRAGTAAAMIVATVSTIGAANTISGSHAATPNSRFAIINPAPIAAGIPSAMPMPTGLNAPRKTIAT